MFKGFPSVCSLPVSRALSAVNRPAHISVNDLWAGFAEARWKFLNVVRWCGVSDDDRTLWAGIFNDLESGISTGPYPFVYMDKKTNGAWTPTVRFVVGLSGNILGGRTAPGVLGKHFRPSLNARSLNVREHKVTAALSPCRSQVWGPGAFMALVNGRCRYTGEAKFVFSDAGQEHCAETVIQMHALAALGWRSAFFFAFFLPSRVETTWRRPSKHVVKHFCCSSQIARGDPS